MLGSRFGRSRCSCPPRSAGRCSRRSPRPASPPEPPTTASWRSRPGPRAGPADARRTRPGHLSPARRGLPLAGLTRPPILRRRARPRPHPRLPVDRRLGLRRRRRDPGRPEGLRPRRGARHDGDHGDHGAEHGGGDGVEAVSPAMIVAQVRAVVETSASTRSRSGCSAAWRAHARGGGLRPPGPGHADRRRPGDGGRVGRAAARRGRPGGARRARRSPAPRWSRPTSPRRACSPATRARGRGARARRPRARPRRGGRHRRAPRAGDRHRLRRRARGRARGPALRRRRRPRLGLHALLDAGGELALGDDLEAAAREAKRVASEAVRDGLRAIGAGAGPVDVLGLARPR